MQWSAEQSWVEFHFKYYSNPGPRLPKSGALTTRLPFYPQMAGEISADDIVKYFSYFPQKTEFDISYKLSP